MLLFCTQNKLALVTSNHLKINSAIFKRHYMRDHRFASILPIIGDIGCITTKQRRWIDMISISNRLILMDEKKYKARIQNGLQFYQMVKWKSMWWYQNSCDRKLKQFFTVELNKHWHWSVYCKY